MDVNSILVKWRLIHALKDVALPLAPYKGARAASKEGSTELRPRIDQLFLLFRLLLLNIFSNHFAI